MSDAKGVVRTWAHDWACKSCRAYGNFPVQVTGGPKDPVTGKPTPRTDDETFWRLAWEAHKAASPFCAQREVLFGRMWRWEPNPHGGRQMIVMPRGPNDTDTEYSWPPWIGREKGYW